MTENPTARLVEPRTVIVPAGEKVPVSWIETDALEAALADLYGKRSSIETRIRAIEHVLADRRCLLPSGRLSAVEHGTESGYSYHRRIWQTPACGPCKEAHRVAEAARAERRAERRAAS